MRGAGPGAGCGHAREGELRSCRRPGGVTLVTTGLFEGAGAQENTERNKRASPKPLRETCRPPGALVGWWMRPETAPSPLAGTVQGNKARCP